MRLLENTGAFISLAFIAMGLIKVWNIGLGSDLSIAILGFPAAIALLFGLYLFRLCARIAALEKRLAERE